MTSEFHWADENTLMAVGDGNLSAGTERDLEDARYDVAEKKAAEEGIPERIESEHNEGIGGAIQMMVSK